MNKTQIFLPDWLSSFSVSNRPVGNWTILATSSSDRTDRIRHCKTSEDRTDRIRHCKISEDRTDRIRHCKISEDRTDRIRHCKISECWAGGGS